MSRLKALTVECVVEKFEFYVLYCWWSRFYEICLRTIERIFVLKFSASARFRLGLSTPWKATDSLLATGNYFLL